MSGTACQVDRASVRGGGADDAPRWRFLVEDALRTAEFGDAGRLVLVRHLRLTGLPARPAPGQAARALEAAWAAQVRLALPATAAGAAAAPAVWFASRQEARAAWLAAWAEGHEAVLSAWFWPAALALPAAAAPPADVVPGAALAARVWRAARDAAPQAWPRQLAAWPDTRLAALARHLAEAGALPEGDDDAAARPEAGSPAPARAEPDAPRPAAEREAIAAVARRLQALPGRAGLPPAVQAWLVRPWLAAALAVARPPASAVAAVLARAAAPTVGPDAPGPAVVPIAVSRPRRTTMADLHAPMLAPDRPGRAEAPGPAAVPAPPSPRPAPQAAAAGPPPPARALAAHAPGLDPVASAATPWLGEGEATAHGGLLFVLNLLPRLGFLPWLAAEPDAAVFVDGLLGHLLDHTGAPPEDPQRAWLRPGPAADDRRLRAWRLRLRRALRRQVGLDLDALLRRPAGVQATPTHIDLVFPLDSVDLRLRRAGLDLDPGWLPWFGRIVSFHYL